MASLSKIQQFFSWCFVPDISSRKHCSWMHPTFSFLFGIGATVIPFVKISSYLEEKYPELKQRLPQWTQGKLPIALLIYMTLTILSRVKHSGPVALYDFLWACNISILLMIVGLLKKRPLLVSASMILIAIDQVFYWFCKGTL